jgi:hypothetical protein
LEDGQRAKQETADAKGIITPIKKERKKKGILGFKR